MEVNGERLWERIAVLGEIGGMPDGGVSRLAFSPEDRQAVDIVTGWMREAGLDVRTDAAGNVFGRREGRESGPVVLAGSHLDSVRSGGKFDGVAGVLAALEAVQVLYENRVETKWPIEIAIFVNEEGSRFPGGLMGSLAVAGRLGADMPYQVKDDDGVALASAMESFGAKPDQILAARRPASDFRAFLELHIEQAPFLEETDTPVGIVSGIAGPYQMRVRISGRSGHAGAVPMHLRQDPMAAAGLVIAEVERIARETGPTTRGTVGYVRAYPGGHNVIPAEVELTVDIRDIDALQRQRAGEQIQAYIADTCAKRGLRHHIVVTQDTPPVPADSGIVGLLEKLAEDLQIPAMIMPSGAAHDAMVMAGLCPMGMIFVRSKDGLSHCPEEFTAKQDLAMGTQLLTNALYQLANDSWSK
ncbi:Zn-dependent hydrolase [Brevibacillus sp. B_LB10_24]|uniref:Zn-dependent hydrolase n=1 Tax=Brevibacillus sp. B_LB10_24 TaxID=3380645 RepID=UPI0038BB5A7C